MDNKLLEKCIKEVLEAANEKGLDVMEMAQDLSRFHELITDDARMFAGYKIYSTVSRIYYSKLHELGILDDEEDDE